MRNGIKGSSVPRDFDWHYYLSSNPDLPINGVNTEKRAIRHWRLHGCRESRIYAPIQSQELKESMKGKVPSNFDWRYYIHLYPDLVKRGINTEQKAICHWEKHGHKENRQYQETNINTLTSFQTDHVNSTFKITMLPRCLPTSLPGTKKESRILSSKVLVTRKYRDRIPYKPQRKSFDDDSFLFRSTLKPYHNFILVIDFPNLGGGATWFINTIISLYKHKQTFLIARNYQNTVHFYINEESEFKRKYNERDSLVFLDKICPRIKKVFVNSSINHSEAFMNKLFSLGKDISTITHDYSLLFTKYQPKIHEFHTCERNPININQYDRIIMQNPELLKLYGRYLSDGSKIVISSLPDYEKGDILIRTNNAKPVVGVVGAISDIKGLSLVNEVISLGSKHGFETVVFGSLVNRSYKKSQVYDGIESFNKLLMKYKPNVFIETSIWPETYSYTLTLKMLTKLPILYKHKNFPSVVENRLSEYNNAHGYSSLQELIGLVKAKRQDYFYTIKPYIYSNKFWDSYFLDNDTTEVKRERSRVPLKANYFKCKNLVIILSKIVVSDVSYSYVKTRSIYTAQERYEQLLDTIKTVRDKINCKILLFDNSDLEKHSGMRARLYSLTDVFLNHSDSELDYHTNQSSFKMMGELIQNKHIIEFIKNNAIEFQHLFKITGRYLLNENFEYSQYDNDSNIFKLSKTVPLEGYHYTCFYKISQKSFEKYSTVINKIFQKGASDPEFAKQNLEQILCKELQAESSLVDTLGITTNIGVWNEIAEI